MFTTGLTPAAIVGLKVISEILIVVTCFYVLAVVIHAAVSSTVDTNEAYAKERWQKFNSEFNAACREAGGVPARGDRGLVCFGVWQAK